jgi:hypothetical protein
MRKKSEGKPKRLSVKKQPVKTVGGAKHLRQDITRIRQRDIPQDVARIRQRAKP